MSKTLFLSYARGDDEPFVARLNEDLTARGFDVWWDRMSMPARGLTFLHEIRDAIDARQRFVLVIGPKAVASDYVVAEWQHAVTYGKAINPILRLDDFSLVPDELKSLHVEDFRDDARYAFHLENLVRQLLEPVAPMGRLVGLPSLPQHLLTRPDNVRSLKNSLLADLKRPEVVSGRATCIGIGGMGGIGKSVLANLLARDTEIRRAFPDGIFWLSIGTQPNILALQRKLSKALGDSSLFDNVSQGRDRLGELLGPKAVLLVLDDVWERAHAEIFNELGLRCRTVATTRDAGLLTSLGSNSHEVELLTQRESICLLANAAGASIDELPVEAKEIVAECEFLPLALALCGAMIGDIGWSGVLERLQKGALEFIAGDHPEYEQHRNLWVAIKVSVDALAPEEQQRFVELSVFPNSKATVEAAVITLWSHTGSLTKFAAQDLVSKLAKRSLIRLDAQPPRPGQPQTRRISLHALLFDFVTKSAGEPVSLQRQLVSAYRKLCPHGWPSGPSDGYFFENLSYHLVRADQTQELHSLLEDRRWYEAKRDRDDGVASFADDVQLALDQAEKAYPLDYPIIAAYSLLLTLATSRIQTVPLEVLEALTRLGKWEQALVYSRFLQPPERRLFGLRRIAAILSEMGDTQSFLYVAEQGLVLAKALVPSLKEDLAASVASLDEIWKHLHENVRSDKTTRLEDLHAPYLSKQRFKELKDTIIKENLRTEVILLETRAWEIEMHSWALAFKGMGEQFLKGVQFPRGKETSITPEESESLRMVKLLGAASGTSKINADLVRGIAAEIVATTGDSKRALALAAQTTDPQHRFNALAAIADAFGRSGQLEHIKALWSLLQDLDSAKYVGAHVERCQVMLQLVRAFVACGELEKAKEPMGTALTFAAHPDLVEVLKSPTDLEAGLRESKRRKLVEDFARTFTHDTALEKIRAKCYVLEAMVKYFRGSEYEEPPRRFAEEISKEVEGATPSIWELSEEDFGRDQAVAFCLVGTNYFNMGDESKAKAFWLSASTKSERIKNNNVRASILATIAEAYARAGDEQSVSDFRREFLNLIETPTETYQYSLFLGRCVEEYIKADQPNRAVELLPQFGHERNRFAAAADLALALARAGNSSQCKDVVNKNLEFNKDVDPVVAVAWAKLIATLAILGEQQAVRKVQEQAFGSIMKVSREPDRLESLISFMKVLAIEGEHQRAFEICQGTTDVSTKGVLFGAFFLGVVHVKLTEEDFHSVAESTLNVVAVTMNKEEYHYPLALLLTEQAIRESGKDAQIAQCAGFQGSIADGCFSLAIKAFDVLGTRDGDISTYRMLNVMRLAAGLKNFSQETLSFVAVQKSYLDIWRWFTSTASEQSSEPLTAAGLAQSFREAREEGTTAVWNQLVEAPAVLLSVGGLAETWQRIQSVTALFRN
jgi:tetratricopeptide (TPR) repeat protein